MSRSYRHIQQYEKERQTAKRLCCNRRYENPRISSKLLSADAMLSGLGIKKVEVSTN